MFGGALYAHPSPRSFDRFEARLIQKTLACAFDEIDEVAWKYASDWKHSFTRWYKHDWAIEDFQLFVGLVINDVEDYRIRKMNAGVTPDDAAA